jgi:hypothetical protein
MSDKSFVGMVVCPICREPKHIVIDRRLKNTMDKYMWDGSPELCDKCKQKFKDENKVVVYEADKTDKGFNLNGKYIIISYDNLNKDLLSEQHKKFIEKERFMLIEPGSFDAHNERMKNEERKD